MDFRKLIKFGNSSHVISIPRDWIRKNNLEKGSVIYFSENGNNELVLAARESSDDEISKITINLDGDDERSINRKIYSKYLAGYDEISLVGEAALRKNEEVLKSALSNLLAMEIIEQTKNKCVIKDFIDTRAVSIDNTIRRMDILIRSMLDDLKTTYKDDSENLTRRDNEVNKLSNLISRTVKKASENPHLQKKLNLSNLDLLKIWRVHYLLELFADELKRVARHLGKTKVSNSMINKYLKTYEEIIGHYNQVMKSWYSNNEELAYNIVKKSEIILKNCNSLMKDGVDVPFSHAIVRLKTISTLIKRIARTVYQY